MSKVDNLILKWFEDNLIITVLEFTEDVFEKDTGKNIIINPYQNKIKIPMQEMIMVKTMFSLTFDKLVYFLSVWLGKKEIKIDNLNYLFILS